MTERIRVLVVDDSAFMRNALSREICSDPRFIVVGTACDGKEGVEKALDLQPDVITLDVEMPVQGELDALQQLTAQSSAAVIMVSSATEAGAKTTLEALSLGAIDFIPKTRCKSLLHEKLIAAASVRRALRREELTRRCSSKRQPRRLRCPKASLQEPLSLEAVRAAPRLLPSYLRISRIHCRCLSLLPSICPGLLRLP